MSGRKPVFQPTVETNDGHPRKVIKTYVGLTIANRIKLDREALRRRYVEGRAPTLGSLVQEAIDKVDWPEGGITP